MIGISRKFCLSVMSRRGPLSAKCRGPVFVEFSKYLSTSSQQPTAERSLDYKINGGDIATKPSNTPSTSSGLSYLRQDGKLPLVDMTAGQLFESVVEKWPNRDCLISCHQGLRMTYAEVLRRADKFAAGLLKMGLKAGDRVGLWGPNEIEWFVSFVGITRAGLIMVALNPAYQQSEIEYCLQKVNVRAVVAPNTFKTQNYANMLIRAKETCPSLRHIVIYSQDHVAGTRRHVDVESLANKSEVQAIGAMQNEISPFSGCNIQFTSGTTGKSKATLISHRSLVNNSKQGAARLGLMDDHHRLCMNIPFFHAFGMVIGQFGSIHAGVTIVLEAPSYNPKVSVETIMREKCTVTYGTPTMWINLLDTRRKLQAKIDTLRCGVTGGAIVSPEIVRRIKNELRCDRIQSIFGLTETTAVVFQSLQNESPELTENTVGRLSEHTEAMVVDERGSPVPFDTPGELWIRGYTTMMKYWDDEENTRRALTDDGWLKTGDQFILHSNGYGQVVGRLKDMINRGGEKIFPKEIEHFLETHPEVREAQVFGVHDDVYGEEICACVRLSENSKLTKDELRAFGRGKISHFKIPRYIEFVHDFPRTTSGKIQKIKILQDMENRGLVPKKPSVK